MKIAGPQIVSQLRDKLAFGMGRHLYGVLGAYAQLEQFEQLHLAQARPALGIPGLGQVELMNCVMEWKDHDGGQQADLQDNLDHYEILTGQVTRELAQVVQVGQKVRFNPTGSGPDPRELYQRERARAEQDEVARHQAWEALLALDAWQVETRLGTLELAYGVRSLFRSIAPSSQADLSVKWHGREIVGRIYMRDLLDVAAHERLLPSINSSETGLDYTLFVSSTPALEHLERLVEAKRDPRVLFWSPAPLTPAEESLLVDLAAYRALVGDYRGRDDQQAQEVLAWVQGQLRDQMGTLYRIVPDSYGRGRIVAQDHGQMPYLCQGELTSILTPLVEQLLDAAYACHDMRFDAPAPFSDANAVNVINGIVKVGEIPRGARPNRDISAAQNYGFALGIMRRPNDRKLDLGECPYTRDMAGWIADKLGDSGTAMPVVTVYKNFIGLGGPNGRNYGLSKRLVQLYLLCLVREGRIRISLSGRGAPVEALDYGNLAEIEFRTALLDAFDQVQRLKPPEGWEVLAPFAALLLADEGLRAARQDADIQAAVQRLLAFQRDELEPLRGLRSGLADLLKEIGRANPLDERLAAWERFLDSQVDRANPILYLRNALRQAFGYPVYPEAGVRQEDLDDLTARRVEVELARMVYRHRDRIRAALCAAGRALERLEELVSSETRLLGELLEPVEGAIASYAVRYLQVYDQVTARAEQVRQEVEALPAQRAFRALERLARVEQLGADPCPGLRELFAATVRDPAQLSPTTLNRAQVEGHLRRWPQPPGCALTLNNAGQWLQKAAGALARCQDALHGALLDKAALLHSEALRERLAQGRDEPFIAGLLATETAQEMADYIAQTMGNDTLLDPDPITLLARYLKKLRVRKLSLSGFVPSKRTVEVSDVDQIVFEFRTFLSKALTADEGELPIVELE